MVFPLITYFYSPTYSYFQIILVYIPVLIHKKSPQYT
nr:MAG TPA: hypothetical protein [Caudoviricetes sp.]